jgi:hypothetical protein
LLEPKRSQLWDFLAGIAVIASAMLGAVVLYPATGLLLSSHVVSFCWGRVSSFLKPVSTFVIVDRVDFAKPRALKTGALTRLLPFKIELIVARSTP